MSQKTYFPDETEDKNWVVFDAADKILGRLATRVARVLRGKNKPEFTPHMDCGDAVIVVNAGEIKLSGNKENQKSLRKHSGYIGGLRDYDYDELMEENPEIIIKEAVRGMLPSNRLGDKLFDNLRVYAGSDHPHEAQRPVEYDWENDKVEE